MIAYKIFVVNEAKVLTPHYFSRCGFLYSKTDINRRREGYGPFACYDTLKNLAQDVPWLIKTPNQYDNIVCWAVQIIKSNDKHIWSPGNKLPLGHGTLEPYVILVDTFILIREINLPKEAV